jgi:hypothetical protein
MVRPRRHLAPKAECRSRPLPQVTVHNSLQDRKAHLQQIQSSRRRTEGHLKLAHRNRSSISKRELILLEHRWRQQQQILPPVPPLCNSSNHTCNSNRKGLLSLPLADHHLQRLRARHHDPLSTPNCSVLSLVSRMAW